MSPTPNIGPQWTVTYYNAGNPALQTSQVGGATYADALDQWKQNIWLPGTTLVSAPTQIGTNVETVTKAPGTSTTSYNLQPLDYTGPARTTVNTRTAADQAQIDSGALAAQQQQSTKQQAPQTPTGNRVSAPGAPAPTLQAPTQQQPVQQSSYAGPSVVDYLSSTGQPTDFASRARMAQQLGIQNYSGTAQQNTELLTKLRATSGTPQNVNPTYTPGPADPTVAGQPSTPIDSYLQQLGLSGSGYDFQAQPLKSFQSIYEDVFKASGLDQIKAQIDSQTKQINVIDNELIDKTAEINNNPWLAEGVRVNEVNKLTDKYNKEKEALVNMLRLNQSNYDSGRQDARFVAQQTLDQYNTERTFAENVLQHRIDLAEKALEAKQSSLATSLKGLPTSYQEFILAQKDGYTGTYNQYQTADANRVIKKGTTGGGGGGTTSIIKAYNTALGNQATLKSGTTREQFIRQLQAKFPQIDARDIRRSVYETYPDGYDKGWKKGSTTNANSTASGLPSDAEFLQMLNQK